MKGADCSVGVLQKHWSTKKVDIQTLSLHLKNHKNTNFAIGGFLAGLHRSPLTLLFIFQDSLATLWLITSKTVQPTDKWSIISFKQNFTSLVMIFLRAKFAPSIELFNVLINSLMSLPIKLICKGFLDI